MEILFLEQLVTWFWELRNRLPMPVSDTQIILALEQGLWDSKFVLVDYVLTLFFYHKVCEWTFKLIMEPEKPQDFEQVYVRISCSSSGSKQRKLRQDSAEILKLFFSKGIHKISGLYWMRGDSFVKLNSENLLLQVSAFQGTNALGDEGDGCVCRRKSSMKTFFEWECFQVPYHLHQNITNVHLLLHQTIIVHLRTASADFLVGWFWTILIIQPLLKCTSQPLSFLKKASWPMDQNHSQFCNLLKINLKYAQETSETHAHNSLGLKDLKIQGKTQEALQD